MEEVRTMLRLSPEIHTNTCMFWKLSIAERNGNLKKMQECHLSDCNGLKSRREPSFENSRNFSLD